jgi:FHA domain
MKETRPTMDMGGGSGPTPNPEGAKTVMAGPEKPRSAPTEGGGPLPWTPPPPPPSPPASPPPFQPVPAPAPAPASGGARTVLMGVPVPQIKLAWLGVVSGPGAERGQTFVLRVETVVGRGGGDWTLSGDGTISSQHIRVRLEPKEGEAEDEHVFVLYDLASANGTYVGTKDNYREDDRRVYRCELHGGDYILLGETTLVFLEA